jgi:hypothetical protein
MKYHQQFDAKIAFIKHKSNKLRIITIKKTVRFPLKHTSIALFKVPAARYNVNAFSNIAFKKTNEKINLNKNFSFKIATSILKKT